MIQYTLFDDGVGDECPGNTAISQSECLSVAFSVATNLDLNFDESSFDVDNYSDAPCGCFIYSHFDEYTTFYNQYSECTALNGARLICWREDLPSAAPVDPSSNPVSTSLFWNMIFLFPAKCQYNYIISNIISFLLFVLFSSINTYSTLFSTVELEMNVVETQLSLKVNATQQHLLLRPNLI
jgi:uncharacterized integral membrane protein